jgi:hypothetical protein
MFVSPWYRIVPMRVRFLASSGVLTIAIAAMTLAPASVAGQTSAAAQPKKAAPAKTWTPPRTPDGQPDLQGVWLSNSATPLERPKALEGKQFLTDDEVTELKKRADRLFSDGNTDAAGGDNVFLAALANLENYESPNATEAQSVEREFDNRTSLIVNPSDGRLPPLTPEGQRRLAAAAATSFTVPFQPGIDPETQQKQAAAAAAGRRLPEGPEEVSNDRRCITFGVPRLGGNYGAGVFGYSQILQAPGYVVLTTEFIHEARIIPLDGRRHLPHGVRQWNGDSRGRWEGNTLVVDTTNFSPQSHFMGSAENLHLVERLTRVAPDTIDYEITLDDPTTWTRPWTAVVRLKQTQNQLYEVACHEGNHLTMEGILAGARAEEKAAQETAKQESK